MLERAENGSVTQELTERQSDESHVIWYGSNHPYPVKIPLTRGIDNRDPYLEDSLDHQEDPPKSHPPSLDENPTTANHSLISTPSRAYLPFPNWRRFSRSPSSPRIEEDGDSVRRMSIPMSVLYPETTAVRNLDSDYDSTAEKPALHGYPVAPPNLEPDRGYTDSSRTDPHCDGPRQSRPPPIPSKSHLRRALSTRTMLNVSVTLLIGSRSLLPKQCLTT